MECRVCKDIGWVCVDHQDTAWDYNGCCGADGVPCEWCNPWDDFNPPRMIEGREPIRIGEKERNFGKA